MEMLTVTCTRCTETKPLTLEHFRDDPMLLEFAAQYLYASRGCPEWDEYLAEHGG